MCATSYISYIEQQQYQDKTHRNAPDRADCEPLHAMARPSISDAQICTLAQNVRNWDALLRASKKHGVVLLPVTRLT
jgi:hypothetical protein